MRDLVTGDRVDQYEIGDLLARSGMASIYKALDTESGRTVVLKVPHVQYECDAAFYERFQREEEIGRRLDHPNIVRVLTPRAKSRMYLAMEYVEGPSLREGLRPGQPLPTQRALQIARQLCAALSYLHRNGVVHRDVKPENILVAPGDGTVKLLDFGIAFLEAARRLTWAGLTGTLGTPDYMAPEQLHGRRGDARTDVYAIGVILYEMLTGRPPYDAPDMAALLRMKAQRDPPSPRLFAPEVPAVLAEIVLRAISRNPRDRYGDADELLRDLEEPLGRASKGRPPARSRAPSPLESFRVRQILITVLVFAAIAGGFVLLAGARGKRSVHGAMTGLQPPRAALARTSGEDGDLPRSGTFPLRHRESVRVRASRAGACERRPPMRSAPDPCSRCFAPLQRCRTPSDPVRDGVQDEEAHLSSIVDPNERPPYEAVIGDRQVQRLVGRHPLGHDLAALHPWR
ncbi:MAG TPA: serine/threonine-protein kinase [Anaeromyxobacteraceae bacterium]|nr:serine/threonine-protein kinase [Anaeromyxobacteraceae bacterium]